MITRRPLREEVRGEVMKRVLTGDLPPGTRLKEVALADSLGVSRTPLREALRDLEHMGIVACTPGRGYAVKSLSADDVRHAFPMLIALEDLCVAGLSISRDLAARLDDLNRQLAEAAPNDAPELDLAWHRELVSAVDNPRLQAAVLELQACAQRYESLDRDGISRAVSEHEEITRALELSLDGDDRAEAARKLRRHREATMRTSIDQLGPADRARRPLSRTSPPGDVLARAGHA